MVAGQNHSLKNCHAIGICEQGAGSTLRLWLYDGSAGQGETHKLLVSTEDSHWVRACFSSSRVLYFFLRGKKDKVLQRKNKTESSKKYPSCSSIIAEQRPKIWNKSNLMARKLHTRNSSTIQTHCHSFKQISWFLEAWNFHDWSGNKTKDKSSSSSWKHNKGKADIQTYSLPPNV